MVEQGAFNSLTGDRYPVGPPVMARLVEGQQSKRSMGTERGSYPLVGDTAPAFDDTHS